MSKQVEIIFDSYINQLYGKKPEIFRYLMNHERKPLVIQKCCEQIYLAERSNIKKVFNATKYNSVIFECVKIFVNAALRFAEEQAWSALERQRRIDEATRIERIQEEFDEDQKEWESSLKKIVSRPGEVAR